MLTKEIIYLKETTAVCQQKQRWNLKSLIFNRCSVDKHTLTTAWQYTEIEISQFTLSCLFELTQLNSVSSTLWKPKPWCVSPGQASVWKSACTEGSCVFPSHPSSFDTAHAVAVPKGNSKKQLRFILIQLSHLLLHVSSQWL